MNFINFYFCVTFLVQFFRSLSRTHFFQKSFFTPLLNYSVLGMSISSQHFVIYKERTKRHLAWRTVDFKKRSLYSQISRLLTFIVHWKSKLYHLMIMLHEPQDWGDLSLYECSIEKRKMRALTLLFTPCHSTSTFSVYRWKTEAGIGYYD